MARLAATAYPMPPFANDDGKWGGAQDAVLTKLQTVSDALTPGEVVGGVVQFPVADGAAVYLVTKAKPLTLQHVPYCDGYAIPFAHIRGLKLADIQHMLKRWF